MILLYHLSFFFIIYVKYIIKFYKPIDENGPIEKLNKITERIGNSFYYTYTNTTIKDVISTSIDRLDNDAKTHIGVIFISGNFTCIVQKSASSDFAAGLVFGYTNNGLYFQLKQHGSWLPVKEIAD